MGVSEQINLLQRKYKDINILINKYARLNNMKEFQAAIHKRNIISREILKLRSLM